MTARLQSHIKLHSDERISHILATAWTLDEARERMYRAERFMRGLVLVREDVEREDSGLVFVRRHYAPPELIVEDEG